MRERGMSESEAIATAINKVKEAAHGQWNPAWGHPIGTAQPPTQAKGSLSAAQWAAMKAAAHGRTRGLAQDNAAYSQGVSDRIGNRPRKSQDEFFAEHPGHDPDDYPLYVAGYEADREDLVLVPRQTRQGVVTEESSAGELLPKVGPPLAPVRRGRGGKAVIGPHRFVGRDSSHCVVCGLPRSDQVHQATRGPQEAAQPVPPHPRQLRALAAILPRQEKVEHDSSGMVSLDLPNRLPRVEGGEDPATHHITIAFLGNDMDEATFEAACTRAKNVAAEHEPPAGLISGTGTFPPTEFSDGKVPFYAKPYVRGIGDLHRAFGDMDQSSFSTYVPHVTLAYLEPGAPKPPPLPPQRVSFTHLSVHGPEGRVERYPFLGQGPETVRSEGKRHRGTPGHRPVLTGHVKGDASRHAKAHSKAMLDEADRLEPGVASVAKDLFDHQRRTVLATLRAKLNARSGKGALSPTDIANVFDLDHWNRVASDRFATALAVPVGSARGLVRAQAGLPEDESGTRGRVVIGGRVLGEPSGTPVLVTGKGPGPRVPTPASLPARIEAQLHVPPLISSPTAGAPDLVRSRANRLAGEVNETTYNAIKAQLAEGVAAGESQRKLAARVRSVFSEADQVRAARIARTETLGALNHAAWDYAMGQPRTVVAAKRWIGVNDDRERLAHRLTNNQTVPIVHPFYVTGYPAMFPGDPSLPPDLLVNCRCVRGDQLVSARGVRAAFARDYEGDMVEATTASGYHIAVTPNHPILTPTGWIAAGRLSEGDYVISSGTGKGMAWRDPYVDDMPTPIGELFDSLALSSTVGRPKRVRGTPMDFHGDGSDGKVDVILLDNQLPDSSYTTVLQHGGELHFTRAHAEMGIASPLAPIGGAFHTQSVGLGSSTQLNACGNQTLANGYSRDIESTSQGLFGFASLISGNDLIGQLSPSGIRSRAFAARSGVHPEFVQPCRQSLRSDVRHSATGYQRLPVAEKVDRIIKITRVSFTGHVYNLSTSTQRYMVGGIVTHNCLAIYLPPAMAGAAGITYPAVA